MRFWGLLHNTLTFSVTIDSHHAFLGLLSRFAFNRSVAVDYSFPREFFPSWNFTPIQSIAIHPSRVYQFQSFQGTNKKTPFLTLIKQTFAQTELQP